MAQQPEAVDTVTAQLDENNGTFEEAGRRLAEAYAGPGAALGGAFLDTLISLATKVIEDCLSEGTSETQLNRLAQRGGPFIRRRVRRTIEEALYRQGGPGAYDAKDGDNIVRSVLTAGARSNDKEIIKFIRAGRIRNG